MYFSRRCGWCNFRSPSSSRRLEIWKFLGGAAFSREAEKSGCTRGSTARKSFWVNWLNIFQEKDELLTPKISCIFFCHSKLVFTFIPSFVFVVLYFFSLSLKRTISPKCINLRLLTTWIGSHEHMLVNISLTCLYFWPWMDAFLSPTPVHAPHACPASISPSTEIWESRADWTCTEVRHLEIECPDWGFLIWGSWPSSCGSLNFLRECALSLRTSLHIK